MPSQKFERDIAGVNVVVIIYDQQDSHAEQKAVGGENFSHHCFIWADNCHERFHAFAETVDYVEMFEGVTWRALGYTFTAALYGILAQTENDIRRRMFDTGMIYDQPAPKPFEPAELPQPEAPFTMERLFAALGLSRCDDCDDDYEQKVQREEIASLANCDGSGSVDTDDYRAALGLPPCDDCSEEN